MNRSDVHRVFGSTHTAANFGIEHGRVVNHGFAPYEISQHGNIRVEQRMISERQAPGEHYARLQESRIEVYRPSPAELRQSTVSPNFRKGERPLSEIFKLIPECGYRLPESDPIMDLLTYVLCIIEQILL